MGLRERREKSWSSDTDERCSGSAKLSLIGFLSWLVCNLLAHMHSSIFFVFFFFVSSFLHDDTEFMKCVCEIVVGKNALLLKRLNGNISWNRKL